MVGQSPTGTTILDMVYFGDKFEMLVTVTNILSFMSPTRMVYFEIFLNDQALSFLQILVSIQNVLEIQMLAFQ